MPHHNQFKNGPILFLVVLENVFFLPFSMSKLPIYIYIYISFQTGHTALQRAASEGHLEVVKHLIGRGAPVDHQDDVVCKLQIHLHAFVL